MAAGLIYLPSFMPAEDANGIRVPAARAYFYDDGTTTLKAVYQNIGLSTEYGAYVEANSVGVFPEIYADDDELYTVSVTDQYGDPLPDGTLSGVRSAQAQITTEATVSPFAAGLLEAENVAEARTILGVTAPRGQLAGLTLSTAGSSATFATAAGEATDSTSADTIALASAMSKTTGAWSAGTGNGGLATGTIANSTWYHVYLLKNPTTNAVDVAISTSAATPGGAPVAAGFTLFRRIGAMRTNGSAQWTKFSQEGDEFLWDVSVGDLSTTIGTTATTFGVTVPSGLKVQAKMSVSISNAAASIAVLVTALDQSDQAAGGGIGNYQVITQIAGGQVAVPFTCRTNTSGQMRARAAAATTSFTVVTHGWIDRRGRDD